LSQVLHAPSRSTRGPDAEVSRLYAEYGDKLFRFCLGQLRSREEAEDAVQNTFLRVCTALRKGVTPEFEGPWLYKIAHNVCLSKQRNSYRRRLVEAPSDFELIEELVPARDSDSDELFGLSSALRVLPEQQRRALLLREWQGLSYREIADEMRLSQAAVETLLFRARRSLAEALTAEPAARPKRGRPRLAVVQP
jgi:RNA polymerase sigma factor (sigma-70 family)